MQHLTSSPIVPLTGNDASGHAACVLCPRCHHGSYTETHSEM